MNITAARWAQDSDAPAMARYVLLTLACHADRDGCAWPSVATLAADTGLGRRTVQRSLTTLEKLGLVAVERRRGRPTIYSLVIHKGASGASEWRTQGAPHRPKGAPQTTKRGATVAPNGFDGIDGGGVAAPLSTRASGAAANSGAITTRDGATFLPGTGWIS